ncbi:hypothetical protein V8G54_024026 [Vigna mungo]|uniref:Uncharacterized protein n=1 Tax=Vigna mungo TaxID=3915 RepID=A0AAQ3N6D3_VIGMU
MKAFHQMSARELKSKFSQGEEILAPGIDLQGVNSPELPSSVSRSRGKHYNNKKWEGINLNTLLDKQTSRRGLQQYSSFEEKLCQRLVVAKHWVVLVQIARQVEALQEAQLHLITLRSIRRYLANHVIRKEVHQLGGLVLRNVVLQEKSQTFSHKRNVWG